MKKLILLLLFIPLVSIGQKSNDADALKLCVALQQTNFTTDAEAEDAVNKILSVIGASQKPVLQACSNINNAVAAVYKGQRYILYDRVFMNSLTAGSNQYWSNMFILAHEMGHHINGHSLDIVLYASDIIDPKSLEEKRKQELEADEFAGFVLAKLGASLSQTSKVLLNIPRISNENSSTHPSKNKRIASVRVGFKKGEITKTKSSVIVKKVKKEDEFNSYAAWENILKNSNEVYKQKPGKALYIQIKSLNNDEESSDPFERKATREQSVTTSTSWVVGKAEGMPNLNPRLTIVQEKRTPYFRRGKGDSYPISIEDQPLTMYLENFDLENIFSKSYNQTYKWIQFNTANRIRYPNWGGRGPGYDYKVEFLIDDNTYIFYTELQEPYDDGSGGQLKKMIFKHNCMSTIETIDKSFISKLKSGSKLYIKVTGVKPNWKYLDSPCLFYKPNKETTSEYYSFSLEGSSKALKFID